jgi:hypothetical protein
MSVEPIVLRSFYLREGGEQRQGSVRACSRAVSLAAAPPDAHQEIGKVIVGPGLVVDDLLTVRGLFEGV